MKVDLSTLKVGDKVKFRNGETDTVTKLEKRDLLYTYNIRIITYSADRAYLQNGFYISENNRNPYDIVEIIPQKELNDIINRHKTHTFKRTFNSKDSPTLDLVNCALGLGGEAGEVVDLIKKSVFYGDDTASELVDVKLPVLNKEVREKLKNEIGDVVFYLQGICDITGLSLEECMEANIAKLYKRFPDKFQAI